MTVRLDPAIQHWMTADTTRAVMKALRGEARFVGGAVRNALLNEPVSDIDIATPLTPDEIMRRLKDAKLGAIPTGIEHGTVTAVAGGKAFEITTLRRDVETDGRRATVSYTANWSEDAARRDFTMNAIYADEDGTLFDPAGGVADLEARHVRFVGDPSLRIREDYLRILRLFRFHAWYGKDPIDKDAFNAAVAEKDGIKRLSGERVQKEVLRLLEAPDPVPALHAMREGKILAEILPPPAHIERLDRLAGILRAQALAPEAIVLLASLLPAHDAAADTASRLKLSNADRDRLIGATDTQLTVNVSMSAEMARRTLYRVGGQRFKDRLLLSWASSEADMKDSSWSALLAVSRDWQKPVFPLDGRDALAAGVDEGPAIGRVLAALEQWWVEQDFAPDRTALLAQMHDLLSKPNA